MADTVLIGRGKTIVHIPQKDWEEEHASEYRATTHQIDGTYMSLGQSCYATRIVQGALFAV